MTETLKIGMAVPFTGPASLRLNGPLMHGGTHSWISHYNEQGGFRGQAIELIVEDSAYDIDVTAAAIRKLHEEDGVVALLNTNGTPQLTAALPYLQREKLPLILPFGGAEGWFNPPRWGVLGTQAPFNDVGYLLGDWAARETKKRVVVLHPHYPEISPLMAEQAVDGFNATRPEGAKIFPVSVELGCEDGHAMADAVLEHEPDAIIVLVNWIELLAVTRELKSREASLPLYSWTANTTQEVARRGQDVLEGTKAYSSILVSPMGDTPACELFRSAMDQYAPEVTQDFLSMTAFAQAKIFTAALDRVEGTVTPDSLVAAFETLDRFETGILPPVTFSSSQTMGVRHIQPMRLESGIWTPTGHTQELPFVVARD